MCFQKIQSQTKTKDKRKQKNSQQGKNVYITLHFKKARLEKCLTEKPELFEPVLAPAETDDPNRTQHKCTYIYIEISRDQTRGKYCIYFKIRFESVWTLTSVS